MESPDWQSLAERLVQVLSGEGPIAVAFSGGVDSSVVAKAAFLARGERALAVTGVSPSLAAGELDACRKIASIIGIRHVVIETNEFANPAYAANDGTRCYFCKSTLYDRIAERRAEWGVELICSGANLDDLGDYRPGLKAAAERGVRHPLQEAGFTKEMTRTLAKGWQLPNWNKPASPCLSSRLAVGVSVTPERTERVDLAERYLKGLGLSVVRVRYHEGDLARIETDPADIPRLTDPAVREPMTKYLKEIGFKFVSIDLEGFRSGGLNVLVPIELLVRS